MDIFENICRTCGNDCLDAVNIFEDSVMVQQKNIPINEILTECLPAFATLPAVTQDDNYPKQICRVCIKKLIMIYEFNHKWVTANNEFNVALKFEQRRNRSRQSLILASNDQMMVIADTPDNNVIEETIVFKQEPIKDTELDAVISESELGTEQITKSPETVDSIASNYQCALCEERYHTLAAYEKHHKVSHRDCEFIRLDNRFNHIN